MLAASQVASNSDTLYETAMTESCMHIKLLDLAVPLVGPLAAGQCVSFLTS